MKSRNRLFPFLPGLLLTTTLMLGLGIGQAEAVCADNLDDCDVQVWWDLDNYNSVAKSVPIRFTNDVVVYGWQLDIADETGATVAPPSGMSGGVHYATAGHQQRTNATSGIILGYFNQGLFMDTGTDRVLVNLSFSDIPVGAAVCLTNIRFSDVSNDAIPARTSAAHDVEGPADDCIVFNGNDAPAFTSQPMPAETLDAAYFFDAPSAPIGSPGLWLEPTQLANSYTDHEGSVRRWDDQSGSNRHHVRTNYLQQPQIRADHAINGRATLHFDGDDVLPGSYATPFGLDYTVFGVGQMISQNARLYTTVGPNWLMGYWSGRSDRMYTNGWIHQGASLDTSPLIYAGAGSTGGNTFFERNGISINNGGPKVAPSVFSLGAWDSTANGIFSEFSEADVAEFIAYSSTLSANDRQGVALYLAQKYAIDGDYNYETSVPDLSPNSYTLASEGTAGLTYDAGLDDGVARFQGASDNFDPAGTINLDSDWTITTRFNGLAAGTPMTLTRGTVDAQIVIDGSGQLGTDNGVFIACDSTDDQTLLTGWHSIAARGTAGQTDFFIDGVYECTSTYQSTSNIDAIGGSSGERFADYIDDFMLFADALTDEQIAAAHTSTIFVEEGDTFSYTITATDGNPGDVLTMAATNQGVWAGGGGSGPSLSPGAPGVWTLSGVPDNTDVGSVPVTLTLQDAQGATVTQDFTIEVANANDAPQFDVVPFGPLNVDEDIVPAWERCINVSDPDEIHGDTLSVSIASLNAPPRTWLATTSPTGTCAGFDAMIQGTPLQADVDAGNNLFRLTVTDSGGLTDTHDFTLIIDNVNDEPTIATTPTVLQVIEGGSTVITLAHLNINDEDDSNLDNPTTNTLAGTIDIIQLGNPTYGNLVRPVPGPVTEFTYQELLDGDISYEHDDTEHDGGADCNPVPNPASYPAIGDCQDVFRFYIDDNEAVPVNGNIGPFFIYVDVLPQNDAPVLTNQPMTVTEGTANNLVSTALLYATDSDIPAQTLTFSLDSVPAQGDLTKGGTPMSAGSTFTAADLFANQIRYSHDDTFTPEDQNPEKDTFQFDLTDGNGGNFNNVTFDITINNVNDAPTIGGDTAITVDEGSFVLLDHNTDLFFSDDDFGNSNANFRYYLAVVPAKGTVRVNGTPLGAGGYFTHAELVADQVRYSHPGTEDTSDSFQVRLEDWTDGSPGLVGLGTNPATINVTINPVNDAPTFSGDRSITVAEAGAIDLDAGSLQLADVDATDGPGQLIWTVEAIPAHGQIVHDTLGVRAVGQTFTQADVDGGLVEFQSNGDEDPSDSFRLSGADNEPEAVVDIPSVVIGGEVTISVVVTRTNDVPTWAATGPIGVDEGGNEVVNVGELAMADADISPADTLTFKLTVLPTVGDLRRNTTPIVLNGTFTQAELVSGVINYEHDGTETAVTATDTFTVEGSDGTTNPVPATQVISVNITETNDDPVLFPNPLVTTNLNEGGTHFFAEANLHTVDPDDSDSNLVYTLEVAPSNGQIFNGASPVNQGQTFTQANISTPNTISYVHDSTETASDSFEFTVSDGDVTIPASGNYTYNLSITAVNDLPVLTPALPAFTVFEGTINNPLTDTFLEYTDSDTRPPGPDTLTYNLDAVPTKGTLSLSGTPLAQNDDFTQAQIDGGLVTYSHSIDEDNNEDTADSFDYSLTDGQGGNISTQTFNIVITPVNDPPRLTVNTGIAGLEGGIITITTSELDSIDVDTDPADVDYNIRPTPARPQYGRVELSTNTGVPITTFTQQNLDDGHVQYVHDGSENYSDNFAIDLTDGGGGGPINQNIAITLTPVNDPLTLPTNTTLLNVIEGNSKLITSTQLRAADVDPQDPPSQLVFTLTSLPSSGSVRLGGAARAIGQTWTQADINSSQLDYLQDGTNVTADSFTFDVTDGDATIAGQTFNIDITLVDDNPALVNLTGMNIDENDTKAISLTMLSATDEEDDLTIRFTLEAVPADGDLRLNTTVLAVGDAWALADITGAVTGLNYIQNGAENALDGFVFSIDDTSGPALQNCAGPPVTAGCFTFDINVNNINDAPTLGLNTGFTVDEGTTGYQISNTELRVDDVDPGSDPEYTLQTEPVDGGSLELSGAPLSSGSTWNQSDIDAGDLTFVHDGRESPAGANVISFTFTASDGFASIGSTPTVNVSVNAVNDAPVLVVNDPWDIDEGATDSFDEVYLQATDADPTGDEIRWELIDLPDNGSLNHTIDGSLGLTDVFTQDDIDNNRVEYTHIGDETASDSFQMELRDEHGAITGNVTFTMTINRVNDAPVVSLNNGLNLDEGATKALNTDLVFHDPDNTAAEVVATITEVAQYGVIWNDTTPLGLGGTFTEGDLASGLVTYVHDGDEEFVDAFKFTGSDGALGFPEETFSITINMVNDLPTLTNKAFTVDEYTTHLNPADHVITNGELLLSDPDHGTALRTFLLITAPTNGQLLFNNSPIIASATWTQEDVDLGRLTYEHFGGENTSDSFVVKGSDPVGSIANQVVNITVTPVNDLPVQTVNDLFTVSEGLGGPITTTYLDSTDIEQGPTNRVYTVQTPPANGAINVNGGPDLGNGGTFTQQDIIDNFVVYTHDGSETLGDSFTFRLGDGTDQLALDTFDIDVNPVNDDPVITHSTLFVDENEDFEITTAELNVTDAETLVAANLTFSIAAGGVPSHGAIEVGGVPLTGGGSFTLQDILDGIVHYVQNGDEDATDGFSVTVEDNNVPAGTDGATLAVDVTQVNDDPREVTNTGLALLEDGSVDVLQANLEYVDDDIGTDAIDLTYTITTEAQYGQLFNGVTPLNDTDTFTQADINAGDISYTHDGTDGPGLSDSFDFDVDDPTTGTASGTFLFAMTNVNDDPILTANLPLELVFEGETKTIGAALLAATDTDNLDSEIIFTVTVAPDHGTLEKGTDGEIDTITMADILAGDLFYRHDGTENFTDQFTFKLEDASGGDGGSGFVFLITIKPVNDAPTVGTNEVGIVQEGFSLTIDDDIFEVIDDDNTADELTIEVVTTAVNGTVYIDGVPVGAGNNTILQSDINLGKLTYTHDGSETNSDAITFIGRDIGDLLGVPATPILDTGNVNFVISVTPWNDPPALLTNNTLDVNQGFSEQIRRTSLEYTDPDNTPDEVNYNITAGGNVSYGQLLIGGSPVTTFTQANLNAGELVYLHDGTDNFDDSFTATVVDDGGASPGDVTFNLHMLILDCFGVWGGGAELDVCGVCEGGDLTCQPPTLVTADEFLAVELTWGQMPGADSYNIYRQRVGGDVHVATVIDSASPSYVDTGATTGDAPLSSDETYCWYATTVSALGGQEGPDGAVVCDETTDVMEVTIDTSGVHGSARSGDQGTISIRLRNSVPIETYRVDVTDLPDWLSGSSAVTPLVGFNDPIVLPLGAIDAIVSDGNGTIPPGSDHELAIVTFAVLPSVAGTIDLSLSNSTLVSPTGPVPATLEGVGTFVVTEPGDIQCPAVNIYDPPGFGFLPAVHPGDTIPFCDVYAICANGQPTCPVSGLNTIRRYVVDAIDIDGVGPDNSATVADYTFAGGASAVLGVNVQCNQATPLCVGGEFQPNRIDNASDLGEWEIRYRIEFQTGVSGPSQDFLVVFLRDSVERLQAALQVLLPDMDGPRTTTINETDPMFDHVWYALDGDLLATAMRGLSEVSGGVIDVMGYMTAAGFDQEKHDLLDKLYTELNVGLDIHTANELFGGTDAPSSLESQTALDSAETFLDGTLESNSAVFQYEAWFHEQRNTQGHLIDAEQDIILRLRSIPHAVSLYEFLGQEIFDNWNVAQAANASVTNMLGETELEDLYYRIDDNNLDGILAAWEQYGYADPTGTVTNESLSSLVNNQFGMIGDIEAADAELIGVAGMRLTAIYAVYLTVNELLPNAGLNVVKRTQHPLFREAERRWEAMSYVLEEYLTEGGPNHLDNAYLVDFVRMATAGPNDWRTLGDPYGFPPLTDPIIGEVNVPKFTELPDPSNECLIWALTYTSYVETGPLETDSDPNFFPDQPPIWFLDSGGGQICRQWDHMIEWIQGDF